MNKQIDSMYSTTWLDKATFPVILCIWLTITLIFGLIYFFLSSDHTHLIYAHNQTQVTSIFDAIYFSFVSATTTGFGDIIPIGWFKVIAVAQVVVCWLLLAVVTSKLVSIKQDAMLTELYDISFKEKINRLRSSLLLFRQSLDRITTALDEKEFKPKMIKLVNGYLTTLDYTVTEIKLAIDSNKSNKYTKTLDPISTEILFNSTLNSFEKVDELLAALTKEKVDWKKDISVGLLSKCTLSNDSLFNSLEYAGLKEETARDLISRKEEIKEKLRNQIYD
ncbi:MAG: potassium channel family protein [archaeon]